MLKRDVFRGHKLETQPVNHDLYTAEVAKCSEDGESGVHIEVGQCCVDAESCNADDASEEESLAEVVDELQ